jgi:lipoyl(octanoyl) transferase
MSPNDATTAERRRLNAVWLGRRSYPETYQLQLALHEHTKTANHDVLLVLEHDACITMGRGTHPENLLASTDVLERLGVSVHATDRGGDVTLHAPGQLVAYPIINLNYGAKDVRRYVNTLTQCMSQLLEPWGLATGTVPGMVGLWAATESLDDWPGSDAAKSLAKLGAIGVRISRWVTLHGFALNLTTDLSLFRLIVPCGIKDHPVASVESLTGRAPGVLETAEVAHSRLASLLGLGLGSFAHHEGALTVRAVLTTVERSALAQ